MSCHPGSISGRNRARVALIFVIGWFLLPGAVSAAAGAGGAVGTDGEQALPSSLIDACSRAFESEPAGSDTHEMALDTLRDLIQGGNDPELLTALLEACHQTGLEPATIGDELTRARRLTDRDLPIDPVVDRVLQGLAKGVPFPRIRSVADRLETEIGDSARLLESAYPVDVAPMTRQARFEMIRHTAYAIGAGVPHPQILGSFALPLEEGSPFDEARAPLLAVGCLVSSGLSADRSFEVVRTAWNHGYRDHDLEQLGQALAGASSGGHGPAADLLDGVLEQIRNQSEHDRILHHLEEMTGSMGHHSPGTGPDDDPSQMHGPGGLPEDPGHQDTHGHQDDDPHDGHHL